MKYTVEQVAKLTKLSTATVRLYASRKKLGTREGNRRYFSQKDVDLLTKTPSSGARKRKPGRKAAPAKRKVGGKKPSRAASTSAARELKAKPAEKIAAKPAPKPERRSFWSFFQRKPKEKVGLLDATVKK
jgi:hypothetical protein